MLGSILLAGVLSTMALLTAGLAWHWLMSGNGFSTVFQFALADIR